MQWNSVPGTTFNPPALARVIPSTDPEVIPQYCQVWLKSEKSKNKKTKNIKPLSGQFT